ncbi:cystatin-POGU1-like [Rhineura floridana]|uniref:cystatin-POGU1-like n=1 Tax=Rhineura floridana TaxID=261503 RepID=UPI002AC82BDC|nr:cystatin-POGU1-like [Rhineura floridana]
MARLCAPGAAAGGARIFGLWLLLCLPALLVRAEMVAGGLQERPVSDPDVQKAATFALTAYNQASNSLFYYRQLRLVKAESQVVAGIKYYLTMEVVNTLCEKKAGSTLKEVDIQNCAVPLAGEQQKQICIFQVWSRPWLNDIRLVHMSCEATRS